MNRPLDSEIAIAFAVLVTAMAAVTDMRTGRIPNWLTVGALVAGAAFRLARGTLLGGMGGLRASFVFVALGVFLCSLVPLLLCRVAAMGGGDLKLLAALGAICGPALGFRAQTFAFVTMALYAAARLAYEGRLWRALGRSLLAPLRLLGRRRALPPELLEPMRFGPAILAGVAIAAFLGGPT